MRGLDVLMAIGMAPEPLRFADIQRVVQLPKGTLHRLLAALQRQRLLRFDDRTRQYHVGSRVFDLARRTLDQSGIIRAAKPELTRIARLLGRPACLYVRDGRDVFVLDFEDPDAANSPMVRIWPRQAVDSCAAGLAMLAALGPDQRANLIRDHSEASQIEVGIDLSRALGYALHTERDGGTTSVAAAVVNPDGYPVAAISCPFDGLDGKAELLHEAGRALIEGARRASGNAGMSQGVSHILPTAPGKIDPRVVPLPTGRDFMGENPVWSPRTSRLYWLDILAPALRFYDPATRLSHRVDLPELVGGLALRPDGRLVLLGRHGIFEFTPETEDLKLLVSPEADRPDNRFNTAAVDALGNLWAGTMAINHEPGQGSFYRITPDLRIRRTFERTGLPKNAAWSLDRRTLYLSDGGDGVLRRYPVALASGEIGQGSPFVNGAAEMGVPNGICVDSQGHIWVAMLGGWAIHRYTPKGELVERIVLPVPMPTNLCFGGRDLRTLFVTSTYLRLPPGYSTLAPLSGTVLEIEVDVPGMPPNLFAAK
ncbi:IclR family transcriptional regulator [Devosia nitrariae]|uniref:IclR family transcriptional regulator n=2 Tax=Devosia nitrariae TaxID=2071872 RepID=A0ABQ5W7V2_9HYPH|nr:IclR family transcriptional regulator [Devosia nitrariae]